MKNPSNIPAFPQPTSVGNMPNEAGMTLRDYFAGQAMQAMILDIESKEKLVAGAYEIADAMLKAREVNK